MQIANFIPRSGQWLVLPWADGFYLFTGDAEGQRRGREVIMAFLGPGVVSVEPPVDRQSDREFPQAWRATGLTRTAYLRRVGSGPQAAAEMLSRLEDMVAAMRGRPLTVLELKPSHSDLLRDLRLAFMRHDDEAARHLFDDIRLNGHVSAENLRYLRIEYLGAFSRWAEMRALPHINALVRARRPRIVSETLLQMIWWTELVGQDSRGLRAAFETRGVIAEFGPLLRTIRVPSTPQGRSVALLTAFADDDADWQRAILEGANDAAEELDLQSITTQPGASPPLAVDVVTADTDSIADAFGSGRYHEVIVRFLDAPEPRYADLAVQAVLETGLVEAAGSILAAVRDWEAGGAISLGRRARRDVEDLEGLVGDSCTSWVMWTQRLAADLLWPDASAVLRNQVATWEPLHHLSAQHVTEVADSLLSAVGGPNDDQLRAGLDVLCRTAAAVLISGPPNDFCRIVLELLSEQQNFSDMVRSAYLDLFAAWLQAGPAANEYSEVIHQAIDIWERIASPFAADWVIGILEAAIDAPCPDPAGRTLLGIQLIDGVRHLYGRLGLRQRVELETLAVEFGIPRQTLESTPDDRSVWSKADGALIGLYSLLPRAAASLEARLAQLCRPREVRGNSDKVATQALRSLAERSDYLIVDTWHAAHQATARD